tara:strand:+ start:365 stop:976 length:612 start_codon:yes stop_codon:yes gene_type:complete
MFFSFDGIDGAGKSTQLELFCHWLRELGHDVVSCRDPGSTRIGERIRELLLSVEDQPMDNTTEMLLYMAARAQLVQEFIQPQLQLGRAVVTDRFLLSNVVYQGHAGGLGVGSIWQVGDIATAGLVPDTYFVLDISVDAAMARIARTPDRMERKGAEYFQRVRQGFLDEAGRRPDAIVVVDAERTVDDVQTSIRAAVEQRWNNP